MKIYNPILSTLLITVQFIFSWLDHTEVKKWQALNPTLDGVIQFQYLYQQFFLYVLVIGVFEIFTKPGLLKKAIRILLITVIATYQLAPFLPVDKGAYFTAEILAFGLILVGLIVISKKAYRRLLF